jgi:hypothetical protein
MNPTEVLTLALVVVTIYYAWQTRQTVAELRRARSASVLPRITVSIRTLSAGVGWVKLSNVGPGAALDVDARMTLIPNGWEIPWRAHVVAPGEYHEFIPTPADDPNAQLGYLDRLIERFDHIHLVATYKDALGGSYTTDESIEIRDWWRGVVAAHSLVVHDPQQDQASELEKIRKVLEGIARKLK